MPKPISLSNAEARRLAVYAQGFGRAKPASIEVRRLRALIGQLGAVQIDSVNVLVRSQYLPAFARLGSYDRGLLDRAAYAKPRRVFEYWGHEASLLPIELFPLLRWRMEQSRKGIGVWGNVARVGLERADLVHRVRSAFEERGPLSASDFAEAKSTSSWWGWSDTKRAVEFLYWCGEITPAKRRSSFERVYDLTERIVPADVLQTRVADEAAHRELVQRAARAFGIATEADLRDYFRLSVEGARRAVAQLVEAGTLVPAAVEGWKPAYLHHRAHAPRTLHASALLSPFDSLVWNRMRTHRLFDFHYRIEIYTPAHKRVHGYYVLPYLIDTDLAARVDVKSERKASTLLVHAVHYEPGVDRGYVRTRLFDDLNAMARWLELDRVKMPDRARASTVR